MKECKNHHKIGAMRGAIIAAALALRAPCAIAQTPALLDSAVGTLIREGKLQDAETELKRVLADNPKSADAHYLLGYVLFREVAARDSLAEYTEAAKYRRPSAFDLKIVGCDYVLLADYLDADKWFSKVVEWSPQDMEAWYFLGRAKYNENRFDEAIRAFEQALKLDPKNVRAEDNMGLAFEGLGRNDEARSAYRDAIDWQTGARQTYPDPYINLGAILVTEGQPNQALIYLSKALQIAPNDYRPHYQAGKAYLALDRLTESRRELQQAIKLSPQNASLHYVLGQVYRKEGLLQEAKAEFDRYAALNAAHSTPDPPKPVVAH